MCYISHAMFHYERRKVAKLRRLSLVSTYPIYWGGFVLKPNILQELLISSCSTVPDIRYNKVLSVIEYHLIKWEVEKTKATPSLATAGTPVRNTGTGCVTSSIGPGWSDVHFFRVRGSEAYLIAGVTSITVTYLDGTIFSSTCLKSGHVRYPHSDPVFLGLTTISLIWQFFCPSNVQSFRIFVNSELIPS